MAWNRRAHPNESSLWCLVCVCKVILYEVFAVSNAEGRLHLLKLHASRGINTRPSAHNALPKTRNHSVLRALRSSNPG